MILKGKTLNLDIQIKSRKAQQFEEMVCEEDENLLAILPTKAVGKGKFDFMAKLLNHFQSGNKKIPIVSEDEYDENGNLTKEKVFDCYDFIDEYLELNECSITDLYRKIIEEFDVRGIIEKGMGFQISETLKEMMSQVMEEMNVNKMMKMTK